MIWHVRTEKEDNNQILIRYSYEQNKSCDGLLRYDKKSEKITIEKMSDGADEFETKRAFSHIYGLLGRNELNENVRSIVTG